MNAIVTQNGLDPKIIESLVLGGDVGKLTSEQKLAYVAYRCKQVGLDPAAQPFQLLRLQGKEVLYATAGATQQLCQTRGLSVQITKREKIEDIYCVEARVTDKEGRYSENMGSAPLTGLKGEALSNALLKATTKAIRRTVLAHCGLGVLDELEADTIPGAQKLTGNPLKREAEHIIAEMESCDEREQLDVYITCDQFKDFILRANGEASLKGGVNQGDVVVQFYHQIRDKLPDKKINKRAFIKSTEEYGDSPVPEAQPSNPDGSRDVPIAAAEPTFSAIAEKCLEQFDIVDDADAFKRAHDYALAHQTELTAEEKAALQTLSRKVGARLRESA